MFHIYFTYGSHMFSLALHIRFTYASHTFHQRKNLCFIWVLHMFCMRGHLGYVYVPPRKPWRQIWWGPAQPLPTKWGSTIKNWCKIVILKVQMQAWHESPTAITVGKLNFNVRCKRSRIGVKLRLYPFWNVRHNRFARNKTCVKLQFYKVRRNPFTQNDCPTSKMAIFQRRRQPFRTIWWPNVKNLRKNAFFWGV